MSIKKLLEKYIKLEFKTTYFDVYFTLKFKQNSYFST